MLDLEYFDIQEGTEGSMEREDVIPTKSAEMIAIQALLREGKLGEAETQLCKILEQPETTHKLRLESFSHLIRIAAETRHFAKIPNYIEEIKRSPSIPMKKNSSSPNVCTRQVRVGIILEIQSVPARP